VIHQARSARLRIRVRIAWTVVTLLAVQVVVCAIAAYPVVWAWTNVLARIPSRPAVRAFVVAAAIAPAYAAFALMLVVVSPVALRLLGWCTPPDAALAIRDMSWPLMDWIRYVASIHVVRIVAGPLLRGTPVWTAYLRLNGARLGRRVYINSLSVGDYNLLECGDDVVIGGGVHLSGHTVEGGVVRTSRVRIGSRVTIGLSSIVEIGVTIGDDVQIGALSFVPKYAHLASGGVYIGAPAILLHASPERCRESGSDLKAPRQPRDLRPISPGRGVPY
jgi:acetyltransferase-like isoleucine patch superfamily enzyme